jgi:hypothetical protein
MRGICCRGWLQRAVRQRQAVLCEEQLAAGAVAAGNLMWRRQGLRLQSCGTAAGYADSLFHRPSRPVRLAFRDNPQNWPALGKPTICLVPDQRQSRPARPAYNSLGQYLRDAQAIAGHTRPRRARGTAVVYNFQQTLRSSTPLTRCLSHPTSGPMVDLHNLKRKELQALAKRAGLTGLNGKNEELIAKLAALEPDSA